MIDWGRVEVLGIEIGADDLAEVVTLFLEETEEAMAVVSQTGDARQLAATLHFLKGSALNLGLAAFATLCQEGERVASRGGVVDIGVLVASYRASRHAFEAGFARPALQRAG